MSDLIYFLYCDGENILSWIATSSQDGVFNIPNIWRPSSLLAKLCATSLRLDLYPNSLIHWRKFNNGRIKSSCCRLSLKFSEKMLLQKLHYLKVLKYFHYGISDIRSVAEDYSLETRLRLPQLLCRPCEWKLANFKTFEGVNFQSFRRKRQSKWSNNKSPCTLTMRFLETKKR